MSEFDGIRRVLDAREDVRLGYVFGSVATGRARPSSDLDVAVLFAGVPLPATLDRLTEEIEEASGRTVDLVDLAQAPPLLAHQVIATGTCLVCRSPEERAEFETRAVMRHLDTAYLRRLQHAYLRERTQGP